MERKMKYQYSYFIHPFIVDEKKYDQYLLKLLKNKNCKLKMWEKEKDLNLYTYFLPAVRDYLFFSFSFTPEKRRKLEALDLNMKVALLSRYPCTMFEYNLEQEIQGKAGEENGIFFDISKIEIVCFKTGVCFLLLKTMIEGENHFSDVLNFNYKFRDIHSELSSLKNYENIRLQTSNFKDIKQLSNVIETITGPNKDAKEMNLEEERFLTYSYVCLEQTDWNEEKDFSDLQEEFIKFYHILPSKHQVNYSQEEEKENRVELAKYAQMGFTKQGSVLLTSSADPENYTRLPFAFEQEYLYTYLLQLYKKIYLQKINLEFKRTKKLEKTRSELLDFTRTIWIQEVTNDSTGSKLDEKWKEILQIEYRYKEIKDKYDIVYKDLNIEKTRKINFLIMAILLGTLTFNIINFILLFLKS